MAGDAATVRARLDAVRRAGVSDPVSALPVSGSGQLDVVAASAGSPPITLNEPTDPAERRRVRETTLATSPRTVEIPTIVHEALVEHLERFPPSEIELDASDHGPSRPAGQMPESRYKLRLEM